MTTYAVTAATGQLGRLVIDALVERGIAPGDVVAVARSPERAGDLADRGLVVREGDYSHPETLPTALEGVDVLLLISGTEVGRRVAQHTAVIEAARAAGVARIAYTSILRADTSPLNLAPEHAATEQVLRESGVTFTLLRHGSYIENYTGLLDQFLTTGVILSATDDAPIAGATRADFAGAAAVVLTTDGHDDTTYELGGPPYTLTDLAAAITEATGTEVVHRNLTADDLIAAYTGFGMDEGTARFLAELDRGTAAGGWDTDSTDLATLLGRPTTPLIDAVRSAHSGST